MPHGRHQDMTDEFRVIVVSDIHYAGDAEKARRGYECRVVRSRVQRVLVRLFRRLIWLADPLAHNHLLDRFLASAGEGDVVVANGDYSCDSAFVGVSDDAAFASAAQVMARLRERFGARLVAGFGDHELGKTSLAGGVGGPRLRSYERAVGELGLETCWRRDLGAWVLLGVVSSLVALPVFEPETLAAERPQWRERREQHLDQIRAEFASLQPHQRVVLFCHDPTAIPFLWQEAVVRQRVDRVALTVIGHLHTPLILWKSRLLAGMPVIRFLGNSVRRMSAALREAHHWRTFHVTLCPSLTGCQLLKDGGSGLLRLAADGSFCRWEVRHLPW
jgi:hypothetical protein